MAKSTRSNWSRSPSCGRPGQRSYARRTSAESASSQPEQGNRRKNPGVILARYGTSGFAAYGMLNALYYGAALAVAYVSMGSPSGLGRAEATKQVAKLMSVVWLGSQVTKAPRAAGAAALAPIMDRLLQNVASKVDCSKTVAFAIVCATCIGGFSTVLALVVARATL